MPVINSYAQNILFRAKVQRLQTDMGDLQRQLASGRKSETYAGLGGSVSRQVLDLRDKVQRTDAYTRAIELALPRLEAVDVALNDIHDRSLDVRNMALQVGSASVTSEHLQSVALDTVERVIARLNSAIAGHYVFSGTTIDTPPLRPAADITADVQAAIAAAVPPDDPVAIQGAIDTFFATPANFYQGGPALQPLAIADGQDLDYGITADDQAFVDTLRGLYAVALVDPSTLATQDDYRTLAATAVDLIDGGALMTRRLVAENGRSQSTAENMKVLHEDTRVRWLSQDNDLQLVDPATAISRLTELQTQLQISFQVASELRGLSLTNFL